MSFEIVIIVGLGSKNKIKVKKTQGSYLLNINRWYKDIHIYIYIYIYIYTINNNTIETL